MESGNTGAEIGDAMAASEATEAASALDRVTERLQSQAANGLDLPGLWMLFKRLLHRRGYFVATAADVRESLQEIDAVGEGFDLYELARQLARYDAVRTECLHMTERRCLPELQRFCPACPCGKHRKEN